MEVTAFVGPSGTGKSHRASLVAEELGIAYIIDDGLLIHEGRILAGESAKRERTALAAVRRAIFADPGHAEEVRRAIYEARPERVLVLGTSLDMVAHICDALDLPRPERTVRIDDVATFEEIERARRVRHAEGKHVIPAPTFEVKKSFSGYLVDPLRFLYRSRHAQGREVLVDKSIVRPTFSSLGKFFITDTVVGAIAEHAARAVEGVAEVRQGPVTIRDEGVLLELDVDVYLGRPVLSVLRAVQRKAREMVERTTALNVLAVDVAARRAFPPGAAGGPGGERPEGVTASWSRPSADPSRTRGGRSSRAP
ncbi:MAG: Asp23/Gls24 family envelope stress response protein [Clostridia bacterium]|nr:Asp23/Gls24 family envelope stress response protein [Clostridia bacterium]